MCQVRARLQLGPPSNMRELYQMDLGTWSTQAGLKEVRDIREVQTLSHILCDLGQKKFGAAADTIAQRMREIKLAKQSGSSCDKAELVSLLASNQASSSALPEQALAL